MKNKDELRFSINDVLCLLSGKYIIRDDVTYAIDKNKLKQYKRDKAYWQPLNKVKVKNKTWIKTEIEFKEQFPNIQKISIIDGV